MTLTEHKPGNHYHIRKIDTDGVVINDRLYQTSLILGARLLHTDWPVTSYAELDSDTIKPLIEHQPEVVLIGIGQSQTIPDPRVQREFLKHGIGVECMTLPAACRTFNILMSENRRALVGLILPESGSGPSDT
jgi:uncharacterized protein